MAKLHEKMGVIAALVLSGLMAATSVWAAEGPGRHHGHHRPHIHPGIVGGNGLPSVLPGIGTYAGSISAVKVPGSGIYFAADGVRTNTPPRHRAPKATIIEVDFEAPDTACSFEAGVCVIRLTR